MATKVKTLRLPEDVCQTVESFPGENFTEKFVAAARLLGRDRERLIKENAILEEKRKPPAPTSRSFSLDIRNTLRKRPQCFQA